METTVTVLAEIPEPLSFALRQYMAEHPDWDYNRIAIAALSLFLLQNTSSQERLINQSPLKSLYLQTLFASTARGKECN